MESVEIRDEEKTNFICLFQTKATREKRGYKNNKQASTHFIFLGKYTRNSLGKGRKKKQHCFNHTHMSRERNFAFTCVY